MELNHLKKGYFLVLLLLIGCSPLNSVIVSQGQTKTAVFETALSSFFQTLTVTPPIPTSTQTVVPAVSEVILQPTDTPLLTSTPLESSFPISTHTPQVTSIKNTTATPSHTEEALFAEARERIRNRMEAYGHVQEDYLSDDYWDLFKARIDSYGTTRNILTLEYHGDDYTMYDGRYSMNPASFRHQMETFMANDYHFVTMHEVEGFVYGWLEMPERSVILTTDISDLHVNALLSITETFSDLTAQYGYAPHMLAFIWTGAMNAGECSNNTCWQTINEAKVSGYFTFGSHSYTHSDFGQISAAEGVADLQRANQLMLDNMGILSYTIAWPFETCSPYPDTIRDLGFTLAWGGSTKPLPQNFTAFMDVRPLCLPRLLPPNIEGISMRPDGMTLEQMMNSAIISP